MSVWTTLGRPLRWFDERPEASADLLQIVKSVLAATVAWWLSVRVLSSSQPFLAPWTALLTVHVTVYRSLSRGLQMALATALGVGLSYVVGNYLGVNLWTFSLAILVGLLVARIPWVRDEGVATATTAVFVLGSDFGEQEPLLLDRLVEVGVGVVVAVVVNLVVVPPLGDRQAASALDDVRRRTGQILIDMADELDSSWDTDRAEVWWTETAAMRRRMDHAWELIGFARESRRANPRVHQPTPLPGRGRRAARHEREQILERNLHLLDDGVNDLRQITRTLRQATEAQHRWDDRFRTRWVEVVRSCGQVVLEPDGADGGIDDGLDDLVRTMSQDPELAASRWPTYGALVTNTQHIAAMVKELRAPDSGRGLDAGEPRAR